MSATLHVTVDGRRIVAEPTDTILSAARRAGLEIPTLCTSSHLAPAGSCRLCLCEVEGVATTPASCTTPVREAMVVRFVTPRLAALRRSVIELYLSEQPDDRPVPEPLQTWAAASGASRHRYVGQRRAAVHDETNPFFVFDNTRCLSCMRCVRACREIQGTFALTMIGRGFSGRPAAGSGNGFGSSNCVSCGACVFECPTGALEERTILQWGAPTATVRTTCAYCGVGCAMEAGVRDGRVITLRPADGPSNHGHACMKGRFGWTYIDAPDRLRRPLQRQGEQWEPIAWEQALGRVADEFARLIAEHGPDAVAVISSSRGTNEENYLLAKFMRCVVGTNHIDNCARVCHSATVTGMMETLGASAATNSIADIDRARLLLVVGANPTESHPVVGARIKQAVRRGTGLIVIDPRRIELARLADLHLPLRPGTNVALLAAMAQVIVEEQLIDRAFVDARTEGVASWIASLATCTPERAASITGVSADLIREAARRYARSGASLSLHGLGMTEHRWGSHGVIALCNLALATGNIGRPGTGVNPLRGQNNVQGASDVGCLPGYFAGYQRLDDPDVAARHLRVTGQPLPSARGRMIPDMWDAALDGSLKGLWIVGYDVAQTDPNLHKVRAALSRLEFLVVQDLFLTETTTFAHLVIPGTAFLEKDGTFTNLERRIQRIRKAVEPPDGIPPDWQVVCKVASRMGYPMAYSAPSAILDEVASLTPSMAGVSYERLDREGGLQWPVPTKVHPGSPLMHVERFPRGKAQFVAVEYLPPGEVPTETYPFLLITGRILQHYNCGAQTRRTAIATLVDTDVVEMHPDDVAALALTHGQPVRLVSQRGHAVLPVVVSDRVQRGAALHELPLSDDDRECLAVIERRRKLQVP